MCCYRAIHLKDLVVLHTSQSDTVDADPSLINFHKMTQLSAVMSCLTKLQDQAPEYSINTDLIDTLKLALDVFYSEEEIFELSLAREPRPTSNTVGVCEAQLLSDLFVSLSVYKGFTMFLGVYHKYERLTQPLKTDEVVIGVFRWHFRH